MFVRRYAARMSLVLLLIGAATAAHAQAPKPVSVTLEDALRRSAERHPDLAIAEADVRVAEAELKTARTLPYNPEVSFAAAPKNDAGTGTRDYDAAVQQTIELGAKRGNRIKAAEARRAAAEGRRSWARLQVLAGARRDYFLALAAARRVQIARAAEAVAEELRAAARERLNLGAGTQLEVNVSAASAGRARGERLAAERAYRFARVRLAAGIGAPAGEEVEPSGAIPAFELPKQDEEALVAHAKAERPDLLVVRQERLATDAEVGLARALVIPDATIGASVERTPEDKRFLVGVSVPIPLFNRNQGGRAAARALRTRATVAEEAALRAVERDVRAAFAGYVAAREAVAGFDQDVVLKMDENVTLARESFRAGKIGLFDFNLIRRDLVETQIAYLDALAELVEARHALELASGASLE
jgi:outer membrane protein, heavy metal efflux system